VWATQVEVRSTEAPSPRCPPHHRRDQVVFTQSWVLGATARGALLRVPTDRHLLESGVPLSSEREGPCALGRAQL